MFITAELLRKHKACGPGLRYIERFYPNGAEMIDIIRDRHISKDFLHWGREFLTSNDEELAAYCEACKIINTEGFWYSVNVSDSKYVVKSKNVSSSSSVFESIDIQNSTDVVDSENVEDSHQIFHSSMIESCEKVFKGNNVVESTNVCNSTMVARSKNVIGSKDVFDSSEIIRSNTVTDSYFCQDCTNIQNCMFCDGLTDASYHVFNKPVDKKRYDMLEKQYLKQAGFILEFIRDWPKELIVYTSTMPTRKFDDWYAEVPDKFWKWVRTISGFDSMLVYNITMLPEILVD